jgi:hypothetical protein
MINKIIFKYSLDYKTNIENFKKDILIFLITKYDKHKEIINWINEFVEFYNIINNMVRNFYNNINNLNYEYVFEIKLNQKHTQHIQHIQQLNLSNSNNIKPSISLYELNLISNYNNNNNNYNNNNNNNNDNKIKQSDYINITKILDFNYKIETSNNPYYIISIKKIHEYIQINNFFKGRYIILKLIQTNNIVDLNNYPNEKIEINFDTNMILFYHNLNTNSNSQNSIKSTKSTCLTKSTDLTELTNSFYSWCEEDEYESYSFKINKNQLIIPDGPIYTIVPTITNSKQCIYLDNMLYLIEPESTLNIFEYINFNK